MYIQIVALNGNELIVIEDFEDLNVGDLKEKLIRSIPDTSLYDHATISDRIDFINNLMDQMSRFMFDDIIYRPEDKVKEVASLTSNFGDQQLAAKQLSKYAPTLVYKGRVLENLSEPLHEVYIAEKDDYDISITAIMSPHAFPLHKQQALRGQIDKLLKIKHGEIEFKDLPEHERLDIDLATMAVALDGNNLQYIPNSPLKDSPKILLAAVEQKLSLDIEENFAAIRYVSKTENMEQMELVDKIRNFSLFMGYYSNDGFLGLSVDSEIAKGIARENFIAESIRLGCDSLTARIELYYKMSETKKEPKHCNKPKL